MNSEQTPFSWSFSIGRLFATQIRVSALLVVWLIGFMFKFGIEFGLALSLVLFLSILAHELVGHILVARRTGGQGDEILMWPLGGLAFVQPAPNFTSRFLTAAGGPAVNLSICMMTVVVPMMTGDLADALNPFVLPIGEIGPNVFVSLLLLTFSVNWILFLINLLPVYPLDGGKMLEAVLLIRADGRSTRITLIRTGFVVGVLMLIGGWIFEQIIVTILGSLIVFMNMLELMQMNTGDSYDDSFMGYDFSQGYTSLEKSSEVEKQPGMIARWKQQREEKRLERERQQTLEAERKLDELLQKVHDHGMDSLSEAEKRELQKVSSQIRKSE